MTIAVNTKYFIKAHQQDYSNFIYECFSRLANQFPKHTFIFFSNSEPDPSFEFAKNAFTVVIRPVLDAGIISGIWYSIRISFLLKKYPAKVFINADGVCSMFTRVPQCIILNNPVSFSNKIFANKNRSLLYKIGLSSFIKKAKVIITDTEFSKKKIARQHKTAEQKTNVITYVPECRFSSPVGWEEKEKIKARYAAGNEYFIFYGDTSRQNMLLNLLKAFSNFKKWQKSNMQLIMLSKKALSKDFDANLALFRYRNDVRLLNGLPPDEMAKVLAAAYCIIYLPLYESFGLTALQAMKCNIPVITVDASSIPEICGDAVLYVNFNKPESIAEKLMLVFKDENLRQELIKKESTKVQQYNWENAAGLLWQSILKASA